MISIIIPTYNEEQYLPLLLQSIKKQSFADYEVIVADNNSTDNTINIAKKYGAIITSGGMPGKGRNNGAKIAQGNLLIFLDADVILQEHFLLDCVSEFARRGLHIATCYVKPLSNLKVDRFGHSSYNLVMRLLYKRYPYAPGFCIFASKITHNLINGFDEEIMLGEDVDYIKRANQISTFGILKSHKIKVSVRRFERDGRFKILLKYLLCEAYVLLFGPVKTNIFNYTFGHKKK